MDQSQFFKGGSYPGMLHAHQYYYGCAGADHCNNNLYQEIISGKLILSSAAFFILPAVALLTLTWVYFVVSVFLYAGVMIFIGKEEGQLLKVNNPQWKSPKCKEVNA